MTTPTYGDRPMEETHRSSPITIALAWLVVGIPLAWGVSQTLIKSMALFQ
jgi:hypothetical protein